MKTKLLFVFSFICLTSQAQITSIVDTTKEWRIENTSSGIFGNTYSTTLFKLTGDTTINSNTYKKIWSKSDSSSSSNWWRNDEYGYIRESGSKIYVYNYYIGGEYLEYDFGIAVGDTFKYTCSFGTVSTLDFVLDSIKTEFIANENRNVYYFDWGGYKWIEGIGSNFGLVHHYILCIADIYEELLCYYENGINKYVNPIYNTCYFVAGVDEYSNANEIKVTISPNPANTIVNINYDNTKQTFDIISLLDITGRKLLEQQTNGANTLQIDLSSLPNGMYFLELKNKNTRVHKKILKE